MRPNLAFLATSSSMPFPAGAADGRRARKLWQGVLVLLVWLCIPLAGGCQMNELKVVGQTVTEYFGDTKEARLARAAAEGKVAWTLSNLKS